jgi:hypothetical protein
MPFVKIAISDLFFCIKSDFLLKYKELLLLKIFMWENIYIFFDKLEDRVRGRLSRKPIGYAFLGGFGVVLFWRGVWHLTDTVMFHFFSLAPVDGVNELYQLPWWDGLLSLVLGTILLLMSGLFVSNFIGNEIIISGLRGEKKIIDKNEEELEKELDELEKIEKDLLHISNHIATLRRGDSFKKKKTKKKRA